MDILLSEEFKKLLDDIIARHIAAGQKASGRSIDSFELNIKENTGQLLGPRYVGVFERGRKPGKIPYNMKQIIMNWAKAKGLSVVSGKDFERWANAVAWMIRKKGTTLYQSGENEDIFDIPYNEFEKSLTERLAGYYVVDAMNLIFEDKKVQQ